MILSALLLMPLLEPMNQEQEQGFQLPEGAYEVEFPASDDHPVSAAFFPAHLGDPQQRDNESAASPILILCHQC